MADPGALPLDGSPDAQPPSKRQRTSVMYQRKRAVTACQQCRQRKTKCDNVRPVCGFCQKNQGCCVYPDTASDFSSYDPASLAILDRINHVVSLLEDRKSNSEPSPRTPVAAAPTSILTPSQDMRAGATWPLEPSSEGDIIDTLDAPGFPAARINCEAILRWPVFDAVPDVDSFVVEDVSCEDIGRKGPRTGRGVQEDDFALLSKRFLAYTHVKNPILDIAEYKTFVRDAVEHGPRWDGPSCLVLVTCALGCLCEPFDPPASHSHHETGRTADGPPLGMATALSYSIAAKKRLGLLRPSSLQIQCIFLFGVFEMMCLNPLEAWSYFNQACVQFRNLLWKRTQSLRASIDRPAARTAERLEQRLYWSCVKSEFELRCEIPLPPSGIAGSRYPDLFPSPPTELSSSSSTEDVSARDPLGVEEERSWYYYLAEISHRKMMNRAIAVMGTGGEEGWITRVHENIRHATDFDEQIDVWCSHIPPQINVALQEVANNELAQNIQSRALICREWIHRPLLYFVLHQPPSDPYFEQALPLARRCLETCVMLLFHSSCHRQHGTWFVCRSSLTRALLLLAAAASHKLELPDRWREAVDVALDNLNRWKGQASDLDRATTVLAKIAGGDLPVT